MSSVSEIQANIDKALKVVAKTTEEALLEVGERGVAILKNNTPVDSGRLRNSMSYTVSNRVEGNTGPDSDAVNKSNDKNTVTIGTNVIYAPRVEFMAKNGSQGFMQRSFNQLVPIAKSVFTSVYKGGLR